MDIDIRIGDYILDCRIAIIIIDIIVLSLFLIMKLIVSSGYVDKFKCKML